MNVFLIGIGAAGNKAVLEAVESGIMDIDDTCIINSTSKDFPKKYTGSTIVLSESDTGCGKERTIACEYAKQAIKKGKFNNIDVSDYDTIVIATSVEGGTGSGSSPIIAKFFNQVKGKNIHIVAFTGFEDDVRGLANTVEFFKEITDSITLHTISNAAFLTQAGNNKLKAEELANKELAKKLSVITGQDFIEGTQNIDDTDIYKLANTTAYMVVEKKYFDKSLETVDDFEKIVKNMIYNCKSIVDDNPQAKRLGIILNVSQASIDAIDYSFDSIKKEYGYPYEFYTQIQYDGKKEYLAYIASGMKMPIDTIKEIYNRYVDQSSKIDKSGDSFFSEVAGLNLCEDDKMFDMFQNKGTKSIEDFLNNN